MCGVSLPSSSDLIMHDDDTSINRGAYPQKYTFGCNIGFVSQSISPVPITATGGGISPVPITATGQCAIKGD